MKSSLTLLDDLLKMFGVEPEYKDTEGQRHYAELADLLRVLKQKGIYLREDLFREAPDTLVASSQNPPEELSITMRSEQDIPEEGARNGFIVFEEYSKAIDAFHYAIDDAQVSTSGPRLVNEVTIRVPYPKGLHEGRYRFHVTAEFSQARCSKDVHWLVCPEACYLPPEMANGARLAGVALAMYGLRSQKNWGIGDFSDLERVIDWAADDLGVDFVGLQPLHAIFNKSPFNTSPYLPSSRLYPNYVYLDVPAIEDFNQSEKARLYASLPTNQSLVHELRGREHVDYEKVAALKLVVLRETFRTFLENNARGHRCNERWEQFEKFRQSQGEYLRRFALFCALQEHFSEQSAHTFGWRDWPTPYHDPEGAAVKDFEREHQEKVLFWMYVQWQIHLQLSRIQDYARAKGMLIGLYHDMALGVDSNGADFWAWRRFFHEGFAIGAPPDPFSPRGQNWGVPPPDGEAIRRSGYDLFLKNLEANCRYGGALRIDHVMQLNHLFWIANGCSPSQGVYVKEYEDELLSLVALQSQKSKALIVGEDLGTLPHGFRERLMAKGIFSYRLFYFEQDGQGNYLPFQDYPRTALVSISTHDLPTLAGFWSHRDIELRHEMGLISAAQSEEQRRQRTTQKARIIERLFQDGFLTDQNAHAAWESLTPTDDLHTAVLSFVLRTPSLLTLINQEDLFLDVRQQNFPGTTSEHPNWVTKMRYTVEELRSNGEAGRMAEKFRRLVAASGRRSPRQDSGTDGHRSNT